MRAKMRGNKGQKGDEKGGQKKKKPSQLIDFQKTVGVAKCPEQDNYLTDYWLILRLLAICRRDLPPEAKAH
ncbi:hypothetical protein [Puia sp.]|uniref:hypothetical protein n=1 Tax=Puia sp. TaxID=2045100 RepID=UPI002F40B020